MIAPYSEVFGGDVEFAAQIDPTMKPLNVQAFLTSPNLTAESAVQKTDEGLILPNLNVTSRAPLAVLPDPPASITEAVFEGRVSLGEDQSASGQLGLQGLTYGNYTLDGVSGPIMVSNETDTVTFSANLIGRIDSNNPLARWGGKTPRLETSGQYDTAKKTLTLRNTDIRVPGFELKAEGTANIDKKTAKMDGTYVLAKNGLGLSLPASLKGRFSARPSAQGTGVSVSGSAYDVSALPEPLASLVGATTSYKGHILIAPNNIVKVSDVMMSTQGLSVEGAGQYNPDGSLQADANYDVSTFSLGQISTVGTEGQLALSGTLDRLDFDVAGRAPEITIMDRTLSDVTYMADGRKAGTLITSAINLTGRDAFGPVTLDTQARYEDGNWQLADLNSSLFGLSVSGSASGVGSDVARLNSDLRITGDPSQFIPAKSLDFAINLANETATVSGKVSDIMAGPLSDGTVSLEANGPRGALDFTADMTGTVTVNDISRPLTANLSGTGDLKGPYMSVVTGLDGALGAYDFKAADPLSLRQTENGYAGQGRISALGGSLSYNVDDTTSALSVNGDGLELASALALAGRPGIDGSLTFSADVTPQGRAWDGAFDMRLSGMKQPGSNAEAIGLTANGSLMDGELMLQVLSQNNTLTGQADLTGRIETMLSAPFVVWPPRQALLGKATASGDIGTITELFLPPETDVEGNLALDMTYSLPLDVKGIRGTAGLSQGVFEQGAIGVHLTDIGFMSTFDGTSVSVPDFTANGKKGGTLTGGGRMVLGAQERGAITLSANKLHLVDRREGVATVSGKLDFTQVAEKLKLAGTLNVDEARVSVDRFPRAGRPTLDVSFASDGPEPSRKVKYATELDVAIQSAGRIALRGRGINAALSLDAKFTGPFASPLLSGEASIVRGRFNFIGKAFELKDSRVIFRDKILDSRLDVKAVRQTTDITATVEVTGTLERPVVDLTSDPTLPEDEVLSYILFGRSASQLTVIETARLAAALAQLSGGGGFDLMGGLENALGLDTLDFAQSSEGQTQVKTGKYLSDNVYVEVRSSVEGSPGLAVEWTPRKNIAVEAETSPGDTQRVSVQWQKDFD